LGAEKAGAGSDGFEGGEGGWVFCLGKKRRKELCEEEEGGEA
jgi:hypothetical protein